MNKSSLAFLLMTAAAVAVAAAPASAQDKPLLGIVSITATEANNARYIKGAEKAAARTRLGSVGHRCRTAAPTRPMPASRISSSAAPRPSSTWCSRSRSIGAGLDAADAAKHPGRHLGRRPRRHASSPPTARGGPMAVPIVEMMVEELGGKGDVLALTYHTGEVCRNREVGDGRDPRQASRHQGDQERSAHPRLFRGRRAIRQRLARARIRPAASPLAIWGCWDDPSIGAIGSLRAAGPR